MVWWLRLTDRQIRRERDENSRSGRFALQNRHKRYFASNSSRTLSILIFERSRWKIRKDSNMRLWCFSLFPVMPCQNKMGCPGLRGSEITLYGETTPQQQQQQQQVSDKSCDRMQLRNKVKTNGHFTTYMQVLCYYRITSLLCILQLFLFDAKRIVNHQILVLLKLTRKR